MDEETWRWIASGPPWTVEGQWTRPTQCAGHAFQRTSGNPYGIYEYRVIVDLPHLFIREVQKTSEPWEVALQIFWDSEA